MSFSFNGYLRVGEILTVDRSATFELFKRGSDVAVAYRLTPKPDADSQREERLFFEADGFVLALVDAEVYGNARWRDKAPEDIVVQVEANSAGIADGIKLGKRLGTITSDDADSICELFSEVWGVEISLDFGRGPLQRSLHPGSVELSRGDSGR